jgi:tetratricopeptide (TPR) repeat protein
MNKGYRYRPFFGRRLLSGLLALVAFSAGSFAENIPPDVPPAQLDAAREARDLFERGNFREAEIIYTRILKAAPDNFYALSNLGFTQFRQQKLALAEAALRKALALDPKDELCLCTLGATYYHQRRFDEATRTFARALIINPDNFTARDYLGRIASAKEPGVITVADDATSPQNKFLNAYLAFREAEKLEQHGPADEAIQTYKEAGEALTVLSTEYPKWNPEIVEFRRKKVVDALKRLQP